MDAEAEPASAAAGSGEAAAPVFRKPKRPQNARKRVSDDVDPPVADGAGAASGSSVVRAAKAANRRVFVIKTRVCC